MRMPGSVKRRTLRAYAVFTFLVALWTPINVAYGQQSSQGKTEKNFLWSVERGKSTMYLLGSIHLLPTELIALDEAIEAGYSDSKIIAFETNIDGLSDPAFEAKVTSLGLLPAGQTLEQHVSKQTYALLQQKVGELGLQVEIFNQFKPWLCALTLTSMELQRLGFNPNYGIDRFFFDRAKQDGKDIRFLETIDDQLGLFTEMNGQEEDSFLAKVLQDLGTMRVKVIDMINAWKSGDSNKLASMVKMEFEGYPEVYAKMLVERNQKWVKQIEDLSKQNGHTLVVVGAAHLVGDDSILELLKRKGFEVEQR
ncbi:MAG: TraB/GumN family protein [Deltaproteobacteria bacterium]|nr:MAG: TraB/GumN family protein [Deltaproteobacteria bacterium]